MSWTNEQEQQAIAMRSEGKTYSMIAALLGKTTTSVKHKVRRIQQADNQDRYHHPSEKIAQAEPILSEYEFPLTILETHCGYGGMTNYYKDLGYVTSYDIDQKRIDSLQGISTVHARKCDSEKKIYDLVAEGWSFAVVDIDPYGFPSRYFPHVFHLINDGVLFLTFPTMGVAQINKITIRHYEAFWGISLDDKEEYVNKIIAKLNDYAFMAKRSLEVLSVEKIDRVYRMAFKVKKDSLLNIVGLKVDRCPSSLIDEQQQELELI